MRHSTASSVCVNLNRRVDSGLRTWSQYTVAIQYLEGRWCNLELVKQALRDRESVTSN